MMLNQPSKFTCCRLNIVQGDIYKPFWYVFALWIQKKYDVHNFERHIKAGYNIYVVWVFVYTAFIYKCSVIRNIKYILFTWGAIVKSQPARYVITYKYVFNRCTKGYSLREIQFFLVVIFLFSGYLSLDSILISNVQAFLPDDDGNDGTYLKSIHIWVSIVLNDKICTFLVIRIICLFTK